MWCMTNRVPVSYAVKVVEHTVCVPQHIGPDISMAIPSQITLFHFEIPTKAVPTVIFTLFIIIDIITDSIPFPRRLSTTY